MIKLLETLSNREIAFFIWTSIFLLFIILYKPIRKSIPPLIKTFFAKSLVTIHLSFLAYVLSLFVILQSLGFWDSSLIKDSIFWTFGFAFILLMKVTKMTHSKDFLGVLKDAVKWTIIFEFLVAFYSFSLTTELFLLPILTFIILLQAYSETKEEYKLVSNFFKWIVNLFGLSLLGYISYKTFFDRGELVSIANIKSFVLPIILTILFIPYLYFISLFAVYESLFVRLNFLIKEQNII